MSSTILIISGNDCTVVWCSHVLNNGPLAHGAFPTGERVTLGKHVCFYESVCSVCVTCTLICFPFAVNGRGPRWGHRRWNGRWYNATPTEEEIGYDVCTKYVCVVVKINSVHSFYLCRSTQIDFFIHPCPGKTSRRCGSDFVVSHSAFSHAFAE